MIIQRHSGIDGRGPVGGRQLRAFTMIEIALCLAIIGFALVAIIGVLPTGMGVQKIIARKPSSTRKPWFGWTRSGTARAPTTT